VLNDVAEITISPEKTDVFVNLLESHGCRTISFGPATRSSELPAYSIE
jgi:hypothetical protein